MQSSERDARDSDPYAYTEFAIDLIPDPDGVRVALAGDLDLATAPELDRVLTELAGDGHGRLCIDLGGLDFMDSTGLAALYRASRSAETHGHRLTLSGGAFQVQRLLQHTGLLDRFAFED